MSDDDELLWVTTDDRRAELRVTGASLEVAIDWAGGTEQWTQNLGDPDAARALLAQYRARISQAGFGPARVPGAALRPHAALRVAEELRARDLSSLADLIEADVADRPDDVELARQRVAGERGLTSELPPLLDEVSALGAFVWAYDDDHAQGGEPDPVWAELEARLRARRPQQIHVQVFRSYEPARAAVARAGALDALTHLMLSPHQPKGVRGEPPPRLLALSGAAAVLEPWLAETGTLGALEALDLHGIEGGLGRWLDRIDALPSLRHLGLSANDDEALLTHPLMERLETLDLHSRTPAATLAVVASRRDHLGHLRRLFLPGHRVSPETRSEFADLPARFVSHDRLEALGHDLMRVGYPGGCR